MEGIAGRWGILAHILQLCDSLKVYMASFNIIGSLVSEISLNKLVDSEKIPSMDKIQFHATRAMLQ